jgi:DNA-binding transcriptional ArsR family regulator
MSISRAAAKQDAQLDAVFHALADGTRRRIVAGLARGPAFVGELAAPFAISLPAVSKHLDVLERAGLIRRERDGRFLRCYLTSEPLEGASAFIEHYRSFWQHSLDRLAEYVESIPAAGPATPRRIKGKK